MNVLIPQINKEINVPLFFSPVKNPQVVEELISPSMRQYFSYNFTIVNIVVLFS